MSAPWLVIPGAPKILCNSSRWERAFYYFFSPHWLTSFLLWSWRFCLRHESLLNFLLRPEVSDLAFQEQITRPQKSGTNWNTYGLMRELSTANNLQTVWSSFTTLRNFDKCKLGIKRNLTFRSMRMKDILDSNMAGDGNIQSYREENATLIFN